MNLFSCKRPFVSILFVTLFTQSFAFAVNELEAQEIRARVKSQQVSGVRGEITSFAMKATLTGGVCLGLSTVLPDSLTVMAMAPFYMLKDNANDILSYSGLVQPNENLNRVMRLNDLEVEFEVVKDDLIEYNRKELERLIRDARSDIGYGVKQAFEYNKTRAEAAIEKIRAILKLPVKPSNNLSKRELPLAIKELEAHLETYSDAVHDAITRAAVLIYDQSQSAAPKKASFLFLGEAGVGKTETAKALAAALKRPFCSFNLGNSSVEDFYGHLPTAAMNGAQVERIGILGGFYSCFISPDVGTPASDPVIFIDEIHDVLNGGKQARKFYSFFKFISEGGEKELHDNALGIKIDLTKVIFLFGANAKIEGDTAGALATRMQQINFANITKAQKIVIARTYMQELYADGYLHGCDDDAMRDDDAMIECIVATDASPGARVLKQVIREYKNHQRTCQLTHLRCEEFNVAHVISSFGGIIGEILPAP